MKKSFSASLFFLSFFPLWLSVIFIDIKSICEHRNSRTTEWISIILIVLGSVISLICVVHNLKKTKMNSLSYIIDSVSEEKAITSEFLLAYVLPLFAFDFTVWNEVVLFLIFFLILGYLCIFHNYFSVSVVLELLHYRVFACDLLMENGEHILKTVISRELLLNHKYDKITVRLVNDNYMVDITSWPKS